MVIKNPMKINSYPVLRALIRREVRAQLIEHLPLLNKELVTKLEAAQIFGVSVRTIDRWRESGLINASKNGEGKIVLFSKDEINKTLKRLSNG
jgi:hypothetical protein